jgi:NAD(P)-dependent dehydrogenase (short-subunit alcohol dehydrogenase family)
VDEKSNLSRRNILGGAVAAGTAGLLGTAAAQGAEAVTTAWPDLGPSQVPPVTDVRNKVAYITGGSSGIGLGIARALHEAGAKVILGNLDDSQFAEAVKSFPAGDPRVQTVVHDVLDREGWESKADQIEKLFGPVHILVNNAGVGRLPDVIAATLKDWDWGMGVNFWGPLCGVRTFVPRMLLHKEGSHIVTTSSTDGVLFGTGNVYAVTKMAVSGLMEALRHQLRGTNIGTSNLCPGATTTNIAQSATYRPDALKNPQQNAAAPAPAPTQRPATAGTVPGSSPVRADVAPMWARPQDPLTVGRLVVNGIINNDMWIFPAPEYRVGVEARGQAMAESMVAFTAMPENIAAGRNNYFRTPIYVQEVAHRRATRKRSIPGI